MSITPLNTITNNPNQIKIMRTKNYFSIALVLIQFSLFSQHLTKGYIVTNAGDTLRGEINDKNWRKNPDHVLFLKEGASKTVTYKPLEIKAFSVANDLYVSKMVSFDISDNDLNYLTESSPDPIMQTDAVFLSAYVLGKASLYYLNDANGKSHFFIEKDTTIQELIHNQYRKMVDGASFVVESNRYQQQLLVNMGDCPNIFSAITTISFTGPSFSKLFETYNSCKNATATFVKKHEKVKCVPSLLLGATMTELVFRSDVNKYEQIELIQNANFKPSINVTGGAAFNVLFPRNHQSWSLYNELLYTNYKATKTFDNNNDLDNPNTTTYILNLDYLKLTTLIRYQYPGKIIKPYFNIGVTNAYAINYQYKKMVIDALYGFHREYSEGVMPIRKYEQGLTTGIGLAYKQYAVELRYERGNGISNAVGVDSRTNSYYCLLGYRFL